MDCPHCADLRLPDPARRRRVLQLLALIEHPDALPPADALRIAGELLRWAAPQTPDVPKVSRTQVPADATA